MLTIHFRKTPDKIRSCEFLNGSTSLKAAESGSPSGQGANVYPTPRVLSV